MEEALKLIAQYGFPTVAALYFMFVMNKTIQDNTDAIDGIKSVLILICSKVGMEKEVDDMMKKKAA